MKMMNMILRFGGHKSVKNLSLLSRSFGVSANKSNLTQLRNEIAKLDLYGEVNVKPADLDWDFILDEKNLSSIDLNNKNRKSNCDINQVVTFIEKLFSVKLFHSIFFPFLTSTNFTNRFKKHPIRISTD